MIPLLLGKAFPLKTVGYVVIALVALHVLGIYPLDVLVSDVITVVAGVINAVLNWITGLIQQAVDSAISGDI